MVRRLGIRVADRREFPVRWVWLGRYQKEGEMVVRLMGTGDAQRVRMAQVEMVVQNVELHNTCCSHRDGHGLVAWSHQGEDGGSVVREVF